MKNIKTKISIVLLAFAIVLIPLSVQAQGATLYDARFNLRGNGTSIPDAFTRSDIDTAPPTGVGLSDIPNTGLENPYHLALFSILILLSGIMAYQAYRVHEEGKRVKMRKQEVKALIA